LITTTSDEASEEDRAQTDGDDEYRGPSKAVSKRRVSAPNLSLSGRTQISTHLQWRNSLILDLKDSNLLHKASKAAVDGKKVKAMHPDRAKCGYKLLQRMKHLIEDEQFDDSVGHTIVESMFLDSMPRKHIEIKSIEQVLRVGLLKRFLTRVHDSVESGGKHAAVSIEASWHGTQEKYVSGILDEGINPELCSVGNYGRGAYVGTHAGVAHQYADPNADGWRHMCCVLAVVGNDVVKGVEGQQSESTACDRLVNPTQYCFVDSGRLCVSHFITYRVKKEARRRTGGGFEDPFQRKLLCAVNRAAKNRNKDGFR